jgi:hypothetical protein
LPGIFNAGVFTPGQHLSIATYEESLLQIVLKPIQNGAQMEENIELFLYRFNKIKSEVNNSPKNLSWLAAERTYLQELCHELEKTYESIAQHMETKESKHIFVPGSFENQFNEYERNYRKRVIEAAEPAKMRQENQIKESINAWKQQWLSTGKTEFDFWNHFEEAFGLNKIGREFDPLNEHPGFLMSGLKDFVRDYAEVHEEELYDKAFGAWEFFEETIGIDFIAIYNRWGKAPQLHIPHHLQSRNTAPLIELYHEAVKAYTFGNRIASVVMCRALMEHILQKYYRVKGENLQNVIALAEASFPNLKKLNMDKKRRLANDILHEYENRPSDLEDKAIIDFLRTIKYLVQKVPAKR